MLLLSLHLFTLSWGMITFSRGVTIKSRAFPGTCHARAHPCLGENRSDSHGGFIARADAEIKLGDMAGSLSALSVVSRDDVGRLDESPLQVVV